VASPMALDICRALTTLLEPVTDPDVVVRKALDVEPLTWDVGTLYVYPTRVAEVPFETDHARRQDFELNAVLIVDNEGEEAKLERNEALAELLDDRRGSYLSVLRANQTTELWSMLRGVVDTTSPRMLDKRSAAVRISGWRIVGGPG
jgi:hypothetical protein